MGWKLRDQSFQRLLTEPGKDPALWPDDRVFMGDHPDKIWRHGAAAQAWKTTDVAALNGATVSDTPGYKITGNLDVLTANANPGFRPVGTSQHVFHDLIGNVAEFVIEDTAHESERLPIEHHQLGAKVITDWFTGTGHTHEVAVIGGSVLSPPDLNPMVPYKLPADGKATAFADVGFRLAFTDPKLTESPMQSSIRVARYLIAPRPEAGDAK